MKQVYLSWCRYIRRPDSMSEHLPYRLYFISLGLPRFLKPVSYAYCSLVSLAILLFRRPDVVWAQLAPTPVLYVVFLYKTVFKRRAIVIADCHNSAFRAPFINMPWTVKLMNRCDLIIVHNHQIASEVAEFGIDCKRVGVLSSPPARIHGAGDRNGHEKKRKYVIFPCAYAEDEPITELIEAMRRCPDIDLYLTGNPKKAAHLLSKLTIPENVKFTGFVSVEELDHLIHHSFAVVALTTSDNTVLSSAAEGIGHGRPLVLCDRKAVRELYSQGRVLVEPTDPASIAAGIERLSANYDELTKEAIALRSDLQALWRRRASDIFAKSAALESILPPPAAVSER
jgi:glycosyltransferase involved in cell wall biosynthesis